MNAIPELFVGLCDDAAMFPPGNAPAARAVTAHREHRAAWYAPLVGPFLVGAAHLEDVVRAGDPGPAVLVVPAGPDGLAAALAAARDAGLLVAGAELPYRPGGTAADAVRALDSVLPAGGVVEIPPGQGLDEALDTVAGSGHRAKLRTGGTVAQAFPDAAQVAAFILGCVARGLPFKCTAGLHRAVRHTDPVTRFEHHGFLNILAATEAALTGAGADEVAAVLEQRDGRRIASRLSDLTPQQVSAVRAAFTGYGTCSITEPLAELAALALLPVPHPQIPEHA
ncbi:hypothetical protein ABUW04_10790 [Streptacidiphilus sp. N1-10]|uniref:Uncharacterized protein n=1 Tax=Streptacidiphilus jeojiensis TaxID=3229225 RepID=A0ABV6XKG5_9ACTN